MNFYKSRLIEIRLWYNQCFILKLSQKIATTFNGLSINLSTDRFLISDNHSHNLTEIRFIEIVLYEWNVLFHFQIFEITNVFKSFVGVILLAAPVKVNVTFEPHLPLGLETCKNIHGK